MARGVPHRGRLVVLGIMGRTPFAGVAWQALHYLEGLRRLGYDISYVEDTGDWPYDAERNTITDDARFTVGYIGRLMASIGLGDRWAYRAAAQDDRVFGLAPSGLARRLAEADGLVNLTGSTVLRDEYLRVPVRIYLETDPVAPQIEVARGQGFTIDHLAAHTHHFTFGENLGAPDCKVPVEGPFTYRATRQPIVVEWWGGSGESPTPDAPFTTIASWQQSGRDVEWQGEVYTWSKHHEFLRVLDLPRRRGESLELALSCGDAGALRLLRRHGWRVRDALALSRDPGPYRDYIRGSRGEFTVAKDQNVRLRSGWFSDRSACYLAAGRPVITQDTGFDKVLPTGRGLFAYQTLDDILAAMDAIAVDYTAHSRTATAVAAECFSADRVLARLCEQAGL